VRTSQHRIFQRLWRREEGGTRRKRLSLLLPLLALLLAPGCRGSVAHLLSPTDGQATSPADQLFSAIATRYTDVRRDAKVQAARNRLAQGALIPSRIFDDTAAWTTIVSSHVRNFSYRGDGENRQYLMRALAPGTTLPRHDAPGDTRHNITLTRLADEEFRWDIATDFSLGASGAVDVANTFGALFAGAERRAESEIRVDYRAAFPRASAKLGTLFSLDSIRTTPRADGSTLVDLVIGIRPDRLRPTYPLFASYVQKYVSPGVLRLVLRDRGGPTTWFIVDARRDVMRFQFRSRNGRLLPIHGPARAIPDTLELESLVSAKIGIFRVGFEQLRSDFIISSGAEPSWTIIWHREPVWRLPLFTESLIRSSLRRPFDGAGAYFRLSLRDDGAQTLLARRGMLVVEEGTILRFLGRLGGRAYSDLSERVEKEMQNWLRDVFNALRTDARALGGA
jgi:hypothetical protein